MPEHIADPALTTSLNYWAVLVAALTSFVLGGLWYSPALFGRAWCNEMGRSIDEKSGHPAKVFGAAFAFSLAASYFFAWLLGPAPDLHRAVHMSFVVGGGFVACCFGINYQFAGHSWRMLAIDAGYHFLQFVLFAVVLGLWH
ncbi:MAG: DUF1761 domain-containing protein [Planctomycetes bacterium]|nr:DUF1761 domain-containing protein [Planctomycetota bacterium]